MRNQDQGHEKRCAVTAISNRGPDDTHRLTRLWSVLMRACRTRKDVEGRERRSSKQVDLPRGVSSHATVYLPARMR